MSVREQLDYIESAFGLRAPNIGYNSEAFMEEQFEERMVWAGRGVSKRSFGSGYCYVHVSREAALANTTGPSPGAEFSLSVSLMQARQYNKHTLILFDINMKEIERWNIK